MTDQFNNQNGYGPVSYTHLDVYKRQVSIRGDRPVGGPGQPAAHAERHAVGEHRLRDAGSFGVRPCLLYTSRCV